MSRFALLRRGRGTPSPTPTPTPTPATSTLTLGGRTLSIDDGAGGPVPYQQDAVGTYMLIGSFRILSDSLDGTTGRHGATKNPVFGGTHGWDDRLFTKGRFVGGTGSMYSAGSRLTFPATIEPGDSVVFLESNGPYFTATGADSRCPIGDWHVIHSIPETVSNPARRFAPEPIRGSNPYRARSVSAEIDLEAKLASLPGLPIPGAKIPASTILTKMSRQFPASSFTRVDDFPGGYEASCPAGFLLDEATMGGYSALVGFTWNVASQHILDNTNPLETRKTLLAWMIAHGRDYFFPQLNDIYNCANNGGGHFSAHSMPAMWALWAMDETELLEDYGTPDQYVRDNVEQFAWMTPELLATMAEHSSTTKPHPWFTRTISAIGSNTITIPWANPGDPFWANLHTMLIRKSGDPVTSYGEVNHPASQSGAGGSITITVTSTAGLSVGDAIYFTTAYPLAVGSPAWSIGGWNMTPWPPAGSFPSEQALATYTASPLAAYSTYENSSYEMNAILAAIWGLQDNKIWGPILDYVIYANRANFPGSSAESRAFTDWKFTGSKVDGVWQAHAGFYDAHMETLVGSTRFNRTIGYS